MTRELKSKIRTYMDQIVKSDAFEGERLSEELLRMVREEKERERLARFVAHESGSPHGVSMSRDGDDSED